MDYDEEIRANPVAGLARTPPHSDEAEEALLCCCLIDEGDTITLARNNGVTVDSFYNPANRTIFEVLVAMVDSGKPVDIAVLAEELRTKNLLDGVGGIPRVAQITDSQPTTGNRVYFIEQVRTLQAQREVIRTATESIEKAYNFQGTPAELVSSLNAVSTSLLSIKENESYSKTVDSAIAVAQARMLGQDSVMDGQFITGLPTFDRTAGKAGRGEMVIMAALRSLGKSSLIGQGTLATALKGHLVAVFNRETNPVDYLHRMAALRSGVNPRTLRSELPHHQRKFLDALAELRKLETLRIFDRDSDFGSICARSRQLAGKEKLEAIVIDHIGLVTPPSLGKSANREREIATMSGGFKNLARDLNIPVFVICQLNRSSEKENREPRLSDLKDSSALEQDADRVWLLHMPDCDMNGQSQLMKPGEPPRSIIHEILTSAKDRNGGTFSIPVEFHKPTTKFTEIGR